MSFNPHYICYTLKSTIVCEHAIERSHDHTQFQIGEPAFNSYLATAQQTGRGVAKTCSASWHSVWKKINLLEKISLFYKSLSTGWYILFKSHRLFHPYWSGFLCFSSSTVDVENTRNVYRYASCCSNQRFAWLMTYKRRFPLTFFNTDYTILVSMSLLLVVRERSLSPAQWSIKGGVSIGKGEGYS